MTGDGGKGERALFGRAGEGSEVESVVRGDEGWRDVRFGCVLETRW
jgi:hypothetical protein